LFERRCQPPECIAPRRDAIVDELDIDLAFAHIGLWWLDIVA
jgi:hypothetical protein